MDRIAAVLVLATLVGCGGDGGEDRPPAWCCEDEVPYCYKGSRTKYMCADFDADGEIEEEELECYDVAIDWECGFAACGADLTGTACFSRDRLPACDCESRASCPPECRWFCAWRGDVVQEQGCRPARVVELYTVVGGGTGSAYFDACLPPETDCI